LPESCERTVKRRAADGRWRHECGPVPGEYRRETLVAVQFMKCSGKGIVFLAASGASFSVPIFHMLSEFLNEARIGNQVDAGVGESLTNEFTPVMHDRLLSRG
jgi:hypothetical protein